MWGRIRDSIAAHRAAWSTAIFGTVWWLVQLFYRALDVIGNFETARGLWQTLPGSDMLRRAGGEVVSLATALFAAPWAPPICIVVGFSLVVIQTRRHDRQLGGAQPPVPTASPPVPRSHGTSGRIVVHDSLRALTGIYRDNTSVQADKLAGAYIGKWFTGSGAVFDISSDSWGCMLWLTTVEPDANDRRIITARFPAASSDQLSHLPKGQVVIVTGQIASISANGIGLKTCDPVS